MPPDEPGAGGSMHTGDDAWIEQWLNDAHRRWRIDLVLWHLVVAVAVARAVHASVAAFGGRGIMPAAVIGLCALGAGLLAARGLRSRWPVIDAVESATPALANALRAWGELGAITSPAIKGHLAAQARAALASSSQPRPRSGRQWTVAIVALALATASPWLWQTARPPVHGGRPAHQAGTAAPSMGDLRWEVTVHPPAYATASSQRLTNPARVEVLEGARVDVRLFGVPADVRARLGNSVLAMTRAGDAYATALDAVQSDALVVETTAGTPLATIVLLVRPDAAPEIRITAPGADLRRASSTGLVPVRITARDDIALRDLRLLFTKVSGSGESFTFEDGEWPVRLQRRTSTHWEGEHVIDLGRLALAPGDSVAYHAVAHDARPGPAGAAESERFLIEIAREGAQAAGDFSLPEPEEKFALSQRMVIQLTERLLERRPRMTAEAYLQEAQGLAIAQRRVRAEFVFMLGGEVEDEAEEAAHSHEVEAGRLDNRGQGELTTAVRQMAQAEARLTDADLREALPYEYRALAALQAAFGKARYFMRTLPTPVQLDGARRLQGDRSEAAPSRWAREPLADSRQAEALALLARLEQPRPTLDGLLPDLIALDRADAAWVGELQTAVAAADVEAVMRLLRARLLASSPARLVLPLPASRDEAALAAVERRP